MIDYEKLRLAHELAGELSIIDKYPVYISTRLFHEFSMYRLQSRDIQGNDGSHFDNIDDLITKLKELTQPEPGYISEEWQEIKPVDGILSLSAGDYVFKDGVTYRVKKMDKPEELTQPEPKYKVNQILWINSSMNGVFSIEVHDVMTHEETFLYEDEIGSKWPESQCYPTKSQLIEAQIEYWRTMQHRNDHASPFEPEYCNVSGAKLDKREECEHELMSKYGDCGECGLQIECEHESDGQWHRVLVSPHDVHNKFKCTKCGEFYR